MLAHLSSNRGASGRPPRPVRRSWRPPRTCSPSTATPAPRSRTSPRRRTWRSRPSTPRSARRALLRTVADTDGSPGRGAGRSGSTSTPPTTRGRWCATACRSCAPSQDEERGGRAAGGARGRGRHGARGGRGAGRRDARTWAGTRGLVVYLAEHRPPPPRDVPRPGRLHLRLGDPSGAVALAAATSTAGRSDQIEDWMTDTLVAQLLTDGCPTQSTLNTELAAIGYDPRWPNSCWDHCCATSTRPTRSSGSRPASRARCRCWATAPDVHRRGPPLRRRADPRPRARARPTSTRWSSTASRRGRRRSTSCRPAPSAPMRTTNSHGSRSARAASRFRTSPRIR